MDPVTASLKARLQAVPESASSPLEQQFRQEIVPQIEALLKAVGAPDAAEVEQAARLWKPLRQICNSCGKVIRCALALGCGMYLPSLWLLRSKTYAGGSAVKSRFAVNLHDAKSIHVSARSSCLFNSQYQAFH